MEMTADKPDTAQPSDADDRLHLETMKSLGDMSGYVKLAWGALIVLAKRGDQQARDEACRRVKPCLDAYCMVLKGDKRGAEDLAQKAWEVALRRIENFDIERSSWSTWVVGIAKRLNLEDGRLEGRRAKQLPESTIEALPSPAFSPDQAIEIAELRRVLAGLSPELIEIIELVYVHGLSLREAAHVSSVPFGTLRDRHRKLLRDLRDKLGGEHEDDEQD